MSEKQTLGFQAEVSQLFQLMIHSLVLQQRNLPARTDIERIRCRRQTALRSDQRCQPV